MYSILYASVLSSVRQCTQFCTPVYPVLYASVPCFVRQCTLLCTPVYYVLYASVLCSVRQCALLCSVDSTCLLPPDSGPCTDFETLYFFNARLNRCQNFTFGGCVGNGNRFTTLAECEASRCLDPGAYRPILRFTTANYALMSLYQV